MLAAPLRELAARIEHVGEDHRRAAEDVILQGHPLVDRHVVLDLDMIADGDVVAHVDVLPQGALLPDLAAALHVAVVPDLGAGADLAAVVDEGSGMHKEGRLFFFRRRGGRRFRSDEVPLQAGLGLLQDLQHPGAVAPVAQGRTPLSHALAEVLQLGVERLLVGIIHHLDRLVALHRLAVDPVDTLGIEHQLVLLAGVFEHQHAAVADHHQAMLFEGMEPTDMDMRLHVLGVDQGGEGDVVNPRLEVDAALGIDLQRIGTDEVLQHRDVMGRKGPEDVLLLAHRAKVEAVAVDVLQLAQHPRFHQVLDLTDRRVVEQHVADHQDALRFGRQPLQLLRLVTEEGDRLLHQQVLALLQRGFGQGEMGLRRGGDNHRIDRRIVQHFFKAGGEGHLRRHRQHRLAAAFIGITGIFQLGPEQFCGGADMIHPPAAAAGNSEGEGCFAHVRLRCFFRKYLC